MNEDLVRSTTKGLQALRNEKKESKGVLCFTNASKTLLNSMIAFGSWIL